jgi:hypothetical protein
MYLIYVITVDIGIMPDFEKYWGQNGVMTIIILYYATIENFDKI